MQGASNRAWNSPESNHLPATRNTQDFHSKGGVIHQEGTHHTLAKMTLINNRQTPFHTDLTSTSDFQAAYLLFPS